MSTYIHFTDEQKKQARQTDLAAMLTSQGETVRHSGSEYEWSRRIRHCDISLIHKSYGGLQRSAALPHQPFSAAAVR